MRIRNRPRAGSIPACAGEPKAIRPDSTLPGVYPRVCGGTSDATAWRRAWRGLSPRVRGNLKTSKNQPPLCRSIPACAGEPRTPRRDEVAKRVYPRVCGGTCWNGRQRWTIGGLSPRVRGNPRRRRRPAGRQRSIPACAGEPPSGGRGARVSRVYPRVCGGTLRADRTRTVAAGLSPRVRGNRLFQRRLQHCGRSIPACAGEPGTRPALGSPGKVYPRVCGGTIYSSPSSAAH